MDLLQATGRKRETYQVKLETSLLWEVALGIAAVTNEPILDTLEKDWTSVRDTWTLPLREELDRVQEHNTWKCLLQLLHSTNVEQIDEFSEYVLGLKEDAFTFICLPYLGESFQSVRSKSATGDGESIKKLQHETKGNAFFPTYIRYVIDTDTEQLKEHLIQVMRLWQEEVITPEQARLVNMLTHDNEAKQEMIVKITPEQFVQWATGGISYTPEPSVDTVLLIPHYTYRPWTIEADIEGTKVFYYPISNTSIAPDDRYMPHDFLVERYKALGDETRLRMVKLLSESSRTLQEVTDELQMGKSTVHHHLKLLRAAKLVVVLDGQYVLRKESLTLLPKELDLYMNEPSEE